MPHIYARNTHDLFFAQGYISATDRLWQIDMWRRIGTGKLAEVLGPSAFVAINSPVRFNIRGDWDADGEVTVLRLRPLPPRLPLESTPTSDLSKASARLNFGLRAMIQARGFRRIVCARVAGLLMTRNITREVARAQDARRFGLPELRKYLPPDPAGSARSSSRARSGGYQLEHSYCVQRDD